MAKHDMSKMNTPKKSAAGAKKKPKSSKHDMSKMGPPKTKTTGAKKKSKPPKHDMSSMEDSKPDTAGVMDMSEMSKHDMSKMAGSEPANDEVRAKKLQLEEMRELQAQLGQAYEREVATQKKEDARARELMEKDPRAHVEMMKMEQEHRQLALELPRMLLQHEAQVYQELQSAQKTAQSKMPETGKLMGEMVAMARWSQIPLLVLGLWLMVSPFINGYLSVPLMWNDVISGILITVLAVIAFRTGRVWAAWANTFVGMWLAFAPIAFSVPDAATYANDTLVGMLVIVFAVLVPMMMDMPGPEVPLGWSYNPASWMQRAPILALALFSFFLARYMSAFQLGHITWVWDPIFGDGTVLVLGSDLSKSFPISDAGLGAFTYLIELLSGFMGDQRRWRTMPWMVALFGFMVVPLGIVSVLLIMLQPVIVGAWCAACILSALFMLIMIALSLDEVIAMLQFLSQTHRAGKSVWRAFWLGGDALGDNLTPQRAETTHPRQMFWGVTAPWNLLVIAILGAWLMIAPSVFQTQDRTAHSDHVLGALVVTVAIIAFAEVTRAARFINIALALGIIVLPWLFGGATLGSGINDLIIGVLIIALSISPGKIKNTYGEWNPLVV